MASSQNPFEPIYQMDSMNPDSLTSREWSDRLRTPVAQALAMTKEVEQINKQADAIRISNQNKLMTLAMLQLRQRQAQANAEARAQLRADNDAAKEAAKLENDIYKAKDARSLPLELINGLRSNLSSVDELYKNSADDIAGWRERGEARNKVIRDFAKSVSGKSTLSEDTIVDQLGDMDIKPYDVNAPEIDKDYQGTWGRQRTLVSGISGTPEEQEETAKNYLAVKKYNAVIEQANKQGANAEKVSDYDDYLNPAEQLAAGALGGAGTALVTGGTGAVLGAAASAALVSARQAYINQKADVLTTPIDTLKKNDSFLNFLKSSNGNEHEARVAFADDVAGDKFISQFATDAALNAIPLGILKPALGKLAPVIGENVVGKIISVAANKAQTTVGKVADAAATGAVTQGIASAPLRGREYEYAKITNPDAKREDYVNAANVLKDAGAGAAFGAGLQGASILGRNMVGRIRPDSSAPASANAPSIDAGGNAGGNAPSIDAGGNAGGNAPSIDAGGNAGGIINTKGYPAAGEAGTIYRNVDSGTTYQIDEAGLKNALDANLNPIVTSEGHRVVLGNNGEARVLGPNGALINNRSTPYFIDALGQEITDSAGRRFRYEDNPSLDRPAKPVNANNQVQERVDGDFVQDSKGNQVHVNEEGQVSRSNTDDGILAVTRDGDTVFVNEAGDVIRPVKEGSSDLLSTTYKEPPASLKAKVDSMLADKVDENPVDTSESTDNPFGATNEARAAQASTEQTPASAIEPQADQIDAYQGATKEVQTASSKVAAAKETRDSAEGELTRAASDLESARGEVQSASTDAAMDAASQKLAQAAKTHSTASTAYRRANTEYSNLLKLERAAKRAELSAASSAIAKETSRAVAKTAPAVKTAPTKTVGVTDRTVLTKRAPASETLASKRAPTAETRVPTSETSATKRAPASEALATKRAPASETSATKRAPASEALAAKRAPASEALAAKRAPASETLAAKRAPTSETSAAKTEPEKIAPKKRAPSIKKPDDAPTSSRAEQQSLFSGSKEIAPKYPSIAKHAKNERGVEHLLDEVSSNKVENSTVRSAAKYVSDLLRKTNTPAPKLVATSNPKFNRRGKFSFFGWGDKDVDFSRAASGRTITLHTNASASTIVHEALHAVTAEGFNKLRILSSLKRAPVEGEPFYGVTQKAIDSSKNISRLMTETQEQATKALADRNVDGVYGLKSTEEAVAELSNRNFVELLSTVPVNVDSLSASARAGLATLKELTSKKPSAWDVITNAVSKVISFFKKPNGPGEQVIYTDLVKDFRDLTSRLSLTKNPENALIKGSTPELNEYANQSLTERANVKSTVDPGQEIELFSDKVENPDVKVASGTPYDPPDLLAKVKLAQSEPKFDARTDAALGKILDARVRSVPDKPVIDDIVNTSKGGTYSGTSRFLAKFANVSTRSFDDVRTLRNTAEQLEDGLRGSDNSVVKHFRSMSDEFQKFQSRQAESMAIISKATDDFFGDKVVSVRDAILAANPKLSNGEALGIIDYALHGLSHKLTLETNMANAKDIVRGSVNTAQYLSSSFNNIKSRVNGLREQGIKGMSKEYVANKYKELSASITDNDVAKRFSKYAQETLNLEGNTVSEAEVNKLGNRINSAISSSKATASSMQKTMKDVMVAVRSTDPTFDPKNLPLPSGMTSLQAELAVKRLTDLVGSEKVAAMGESLKRLNGASMLNFIEGSTMPSADIARIVADKRLKLDEAVVDPELIRQIDAHRQLLKDSVIDSSLMPQLIESRNALSKRFQTLYVPKYARPDAPSRAGNANTIASQLETSADVDRIEEVRFASDSKLVRAFGSPDTPASALASIRRNTLNTAKLRGLNPVRDALSALYANGGKDIGLIKTKFNPSAVNAEKELTLGIVSREADGTYIYSWRNAEGKSNSLARHLNRISLNLVNSLPTAKENGFVKIIGGYNSLYSRLVTSLNPKHLLIAKFRNLGESVINTYIQLHNVKGFKSADPLTLTKEAVTILGNYGDGATAVLRKALRTGDFSNAKDHAILRDYMQYSALGGSKGHLNLKNPTDLNMSASAMDRLIKGNNLVGAGHKFFNTVSDYLADHLTVQDTLSNFGFARALHARGMPLKDAVLIVDDATNFSRTSAGLRSAPGKLTRTMIFLPSTMKSYSALVNAMVTPGGKIRPRFLKTSAALYAGGVMLGLLQNTLEDEENNEVAKFIAKGLNLYSMTPFGFSRIFLKAGMLTVSLMAGKKSPMEAAGEMAIEGLNNNLSPIQVPLEGRDMVTSAALAAVPPLFKIPIQLYFNKGNLGNNIHAEGATRISPAYANFDSDIGGFYIDASKMIYDMTSLDVDPKSLRFVSENAIPGIPGSIIRTADKVRRDNVSGADEPLYKYVAQVVPLVNGRGEFDELSNSYFTARNKLKDIEQGVKEKRLYNKNYRPSPTEKRALSLLDEINKAKVPKIENRSKMLADWRENDRPRYDKEIRREVSSRLNILRRMDKKIKAFRKVYMPSL